MVHAARGPKRSVGGDNVDDRVDGAYGLAPAFYLSAALVAAIALISPDQGLETAEPPQRMAGEDHG